MTVLHCICGQVRHVHSFCGKIVQRRVFRHDLDLKQGGFHKSYEKKGGEGGIKTPSRTLRSYGFVLKAKAATHFAVSAEPIWQTYSTNARPCQSPTSSSAALAGCCCCEGLHSEPSTMTSPDVCRVGDSGPELETIVVVALVVVVVVDDVCPRDA